jgi:hypothetical protein
MPAMIRRSHDAPINLLGVGPAIFQSGEADDGGVAAKVGGCNQS